MRSDCPVEQVTWNEAAAFCNAQSEVHGLDRCYTCSGEGSMTACVFDTTIESPYACEGWRLPTEAEWERAARAETTTATYGGNLVTGRVRCQPNSVLEPVAWFCRNSDDTTHEVATRAPNAWGLADMLGNVLEWCHDWFEYAPPDEPSVDPIGPDTGFARVVRGGAYSSFAADCRAAYRFRHPQFTSMDSIGFRPARTVE